MKAHTLDAAQGFCCLSMSARSSLKGQSHERISDGKCFSLMFHGDIQGIDLIGLFSGLWNLNQMEPQESVEGS
jgi:hypothetical protein